MFVDLHCPTSDAQSSTCGQGETRWLHIELCPHLDSTMAGKGFEDDKTATSENAITTNTLSWDGVLSGLSDGAA